MVPYAGQLDCQVHTGSYTGTETQLTNGTVGHPGNVTLGQTAYVTVWTAAGDIPLGYFTLTGEPAGDFVFEVDGLTPDNFHVTSSVGWYYYTEPVAAPAPTSTPATTPAAPTTTPTDTVATSVVTSSPAALITAPPVAPPMASHGSGQVTIQATGSGWILKHWTDGKFAGDIETGQRSYQSDAGGLILVAPDGKEALYLQPVATGANQVEIYISDQGVSFTNPFGWNIFTPKP